MFRALFFVIFCNVVWMNGWSLEINCTVGEFQCKKGKCISNLYRCDREDDCGDGSDEENCDNYKGINCDKSNFFECKNQRCISLVFKCDGDNDCGDGSDEEDCHNLKTTQLYNCHQDEFRCRDKLCIPLEDFCNKQEDCLDGSDEYDGCEKTLLTLPCSGFKCKSGMCISSHWQCDGTKDCSDGSDESNCDNRPIPIEECKVTIDRFLCNNTRCIPLNLTCNGKNDCGDGSDEGGECRNVSANCNSTLHNCDQFCRNTPHGATCSCRPGFKLENNKCIDIDECVNYGICSQICVNSRGSYYCSCAHGYNLQDDQKTCKVNGGEALLLFSSKTEIWGFYLESEIFFSVARDLKHVVGVSQDSKYIYWTNIQTGEEAIIRSLEDGTNLEMIVTAGLRSPEDLAVDWVTGNIYFTDSGYKRIGVCSNDGYYCTVIISENAQKPRAIVLYPVNGLMYWSDWGNNPHISVAGMDGKDRQFFVTKDLHWPNGLTIDKPNKRLYWVDAKLRTIESIRLDGTDRRIILQDIVKSPYAIEVFEDKLFFSDWSTNAIHSCHKFTGKDFKTIFREKETIYGLHIYHSVLKIKYANPCLTNPCSQLCLLAANRTYTCACTLDHELTYDKHNCKESLKQKHLIIGAGNQLINYYHEIIGKPKMSSSFILKHVTDLAYNPITGTVLAADQITDSLFSFNPHSGNVKHVLNIKNQHMGGMDFDYGGNNLYWSNTDLNTIEIYSMKTRSKLEIPFMKKPYEIALVPHQGVMYVVFQLKNKEFCIQELTMEGIPKTDIKDKLVGPKISLAYDFDLEKLFWADEGAGRIESISFIGKDIAIFRNGLNKPVSLSILGNFVFWTQRRSKQLFWSEKTSLVLNNKAISIQIADNLEVLHLVSLHSSSVINFGCNVVLEGLACSHICIVTGAHDYKCECPNEMTLKKDGKTCEHRTCQSNEWQCVRTSHCITIMQRCDEKIDCPGGEDEIGCDPNVHCLPSQFQCKNDQCIDKKSQCDSVDDCIDGSDEENCTKKFCDDSEFQCHDRSKCISKSLVCDRRNDCPDTSDEIDCSEHICNNDSFRCVKSGHCLPKKWECDGEIDCDDGSDEHEKCISLTCTSDMFKCENGRCVDFLLVCNNLDDCGDNTDEIRCTNHTKVQAAICNENQYKCNETETCIPQKMRCNGSPDCLKGDDEENCVRCGVTEFKCDNLRCIDRSWMCDGRNDCSDNSDEKYCEITRQAEINDKKPHPCVEQYQCHSGHCIDYSQLCDGHPDCPDKSDEGGQCDVASFLCVSCQQLCIPTPEGALCHCIEGYRLSVNNHTCEDINECAIEPNICHQQCINLPGSYRCDCYKGYTLRANGKTCKMSDGSPLKLITATEDDIRSISSSGNAVEIIIPGILDDITGMDVNVNKNTIYWSADGAGTINRLNIATKNQTTLRNVGFPDILALDWATDNIYVVNKDHVKKSIHVCNIDEHKCVQLIPLSSVSDVFAIIVDPVSGYVFWSQNAIFARDRCAIMRANMDGKNILTIVNGKLTVVTGLAIDYFRSRIYWSDLLLEKIESSKFDGSDRSFYAGHSVNQPIQLHIYQDSFYWLTSISGKMQKCSMYDSKDCVIIDLGPTNVHKFFAIMHKSKQPFVENRCAGHKCDYMCLLTPDSYACICENSLITNETCSKEVPLLIDTDHPTRKDLYLPTSNSVFLVLGLLILVFIVAFLGYRYYDGRRCSFMPTIPSMPLFNWANHNSNGNVVYDSRGRVNVVHNNNLISVPPVNTANEIENHLYDTVYLERRRQSGQVQDTLVQIQEDQVKPVRPNRSPEIKNKRVIRCQEQEVEENYLDVSTTDQKIGLLSLY